METRSWTRLTKEEKMAWGPGPWHFEDDKYQWPDKLTGMPCLAVRSHFGSWCGYVGVTAEHPLYGIAHNECAKKPQCTPTDDGYFDCDHTTQQILEVHGGLTFSGPCKQTEDPARGVCHVPAPGEPVDVWWLGYDCGHYLDVQPGLNALSRSLGGSGGVFSAGSYKTLTYVQAECATLCDQLAERDFAKKHHLTN